MSCMNNIIVKFKLSALITYLFMRLKLRLVGSVSNFKSQASVRIFGQTIELSTADLEQKYLAADCIREPENLLIYRAIAHAGVVDTFVDIGANCGHVAASISHNYSQILLFEPNPKLAALLRKIFTQQSHVKIVELAIVDEASAGNLTLVVPDNSSGLATLCKTHLSIQQKNAQTYNVIGSTFTLETGGYDLAKAYIKIDVEGFEENIIRSAMTLIDKQRPIVGFEALSNAAANSCGKLFESHAFYCSRFDFLENGGALSRSAWGILKAIFFGAHIEVVRINNLMDVELENFSQIYAVPRERSTSFERAIANYSDLVKVVNLNELRSWKLVR
jgi:FkbM family methyltransferase